jgi:plastocyanin
MTPNIAGLGASGLLNSAEDILWRRGVGRRMKNTIKIRLLPLVLIVTLLLTSAVACVQINRPAVSFSTTPVPVGNVIVSYSSFSPSNIVVASGTSVTWTNQDKVSYFIVGNDQSFAFTLPAEGSFSVTFTDTGVFNYHCEIHPYMQGTITVVNGAGV